jgi:nifR3 family TIM-barrel protein
MANFWQDLPKPFLVLAPMEDVTDYVFREIVAKLPRPDVFFTEFTNADGLLSKGRQKLIRKFQYSESQRPIVAQIWGKNPENLFKAAELISDLKFDGVDINMGCPVKTVVKKGAGAGLIGNLSLTKEIIDAVKRGAQGIPVSVKTRLGIETIITEDWIGFLLEQKLDALTVHGRTAAQMSSVPANWEEIGKAVAIKNAKSPETILIGNGDIMSFAQAKDVQQKYGVDGVMIGRGIFANPWVFEKSKDITHTKAEYIALLLKHVELHTKTWGNTKNFELMKKFYKMYIRDFDGAGALRQKLMECKTGQETIEIIKSDMNGLF